MNVVLDNPGDAAAELYGFRSALFSSCWLVTWHDPHDAELKG